MLQVHPVFLPGPCYYSEECWRLPGNQTFLKSGRRFELFIHGGVNFIPYREQFNQLLPSPKVNYLETYNASEGFFGIQDRDHADDMLLMLDYGIYYEFLPIEQVGTDNPETLSLEEVETGGQLCPGDLYECRFMAIPDRGYSHIHHTKSIQDQDLRKNQELYQCLRGRSDHG